MLSPLAIAQVITFTFIALFVFHMACYINAASLDLENELAGRTVRRARRSRR